MAHLVGGEGCLPVHVRVAARFEQPVAIAQRHIERLRQDKEGLPAWRRPSRFDEADVPRRKPRPHREVELAETAGRPPLTEQVSHRTASRPFSPDCRGLHDVMLLVPAARTPLPPG